MGRRLIIDGNAVYELDEECMLKKRLDTQEKKEKDREVHNYQKRREEKGTE